MTPDDPVEAVVDPIVTLEGLTDQRSEQFVRTAHVLATSEATARDIFVELMRAYRIGARDMHAAVSVIVGEAQ